MAIACSLSVAVLVCLTLFHKEIKTMDLSPVIFLLGLVLMGVLYAVNPDAFTANLANGPGNKLFIGTAMLLTMAFSGTNTFKVLKNMPASAYKSLAPAAISVGILLLLALTAIL